MSKFTDRILPKIAIISSLVAPGVAKADSPKPGIKPTRIALTHAEEIKYGEGAMNVPSNNMELNDKVIFYLLKAQELKGEARKDALMNAVEISHGNQYEGGRQESNPDTTYTIMDIGTAQQSLDRATDTQIEQYMKEGLKATTAIREGAQLSVEQVMFVIFQKYLLPPKEKPAQHR